MSEFVTIKGFIVRKDNIIYAKKSIVPTQIEVATSCSGMAQQVHIIELVTEEERNRTFDKMMVALTGDIE